MAVMSAADANRSFSRLLREVAAGACFTVLSRGRAVATIRAPDLDLRSYGPARASLLQRLATQEPTGDGRPWSRDDLYD
jgi:antitoxin (DNA-binding transcriptional repressor) of toxin-antitoxin stability system